MKQCWDGDPQKRSDPHLILVIVKQWKMWIIDQRHDEICPDPVIVSQFRKADAINPSYSPNHNYSYIQYTNEITNLLVRRTLDQDQ
ncbi:6757_t:CDS:1, partial [Gigaspora rosea]